MGRSRFPVVIVAGCEDDILPHINNHDDEAGLEEERRLMYVAVTRAERCLYITSANFRKGQFNLRSRFLDEIDTVVADVKGRTASIGHQIKARLQSRLEDLKVQVDPERLEQEVALLAQRADVAEELGEELAETQAIAPVSDETLQEIYAAVLAQAALETGWGAHVMQHADGNSSFNLFGKSRHFFFCSSI